MLAQSDEAAIKKCFSDYKQAIMSGKGKEAVKHVDANTRNYYTKELDLALTADSITVSQLSVLDKLTVFSVRHRMPADELVKMNGDDFFIYAVDNGMVGKNSVASAEIGKVTVEGDVAHAQMVVSGQETPIHFRFAKGSGIWKIDLTSIFPYANEGISKMLAVQGKSDTEFIFQTLEALTKRPVGPEIWKPLK